MNNELILKIVNALSIFPPTLLKYYKTYLHIPSFLVLSISQKKLHLWKDNGKNYNDFMIFLMPYEKCLSVTPKDTLGLHQ